MAYATIADLESSGLPGKALTTVTTDQKTAALNNASGVMNGYFNARFVLPIHAPYSYDLVFCCVAIAGWMLLTTRGFDPTQGGDIVVRQRYEDAMRWLNDVANERVQPVVIDSAPGQQSVAPAVSSLPPR